MAFLQVLAAGFFGAVAVLLGKRLERDHWLRDARLRAYSDLALQAEKTVTSVTFWQHRFASTTGGNALALVGSFQQENSEKNHAVAAAVAMVRLLGPKDLSRLGAQLGGEIIEAWSELVRGILPLAAEASNLDEIDLSALTEGEPFTAAFNDAHARFTARAQEELWGSKWLPW